jgi:uncharacterized protein YciI
MFVVQLKFSTNKAQAGQHLEGHKAWLARNFDDGVFLLAGSLAAQAGGAILAHNTQLPELRRRLDEDPFVVHEVVSVEILEFSPSKADARLGFLLA